MSEKEELCELEQIPEDGAKGFDDGTAASLFAVRKGSDVFVYRNRCPHAGTPLNWMPDRFLTRERDQIICSTHGALFDIETGACTGGPCPGEYLTAIASEIRNGKVMIDSAALTTQGES